LLKAACFAFVSSTSLLKESIAALWRSTAVLLDRLSFAFASLSFARRASTSETRA
jgi:hypothetical protein